QNKRHRASDNRPSSEQSSRDAIGRSILIGIIIVPAITKKAMLSWLQSLAGNHFITAQTTHSDFGEITRDTAAGVNVGMAVTEYWCDNSAYIDTSANAALIKWSNSGGLVGVSAQVGNPAGGGPIGSVNAANVLNPSSAAHAALVASLDKMAVGLQDFKNAGIPVFFRPYCEMDGTW